MDIINEAIRRGYNPRKEYTEYLMKTMEDLYNKMSFEELRRRGALVGYKPFLGEDMEDYIEFLLLSMERYYYLLTLPQLEREARYLGYFQNADLAPYGDFLAMQDWALNFRDYDKYGDDILGDILLLRGLQPTYFNTKREMGLSHRDLLDLYDNPNSREINVYLKTSGINLRNEYLGILPEEV